MAVLVEAISVVIRRETIEARYPGGWAQFVADAPNHTLCADANLARVGFMHTSDVQQFVVGLEQFGMVYREGVARDLIVVDQQFGPLASCPWLDFGHVHIGSTRTHRVAAARTAGDLSFRLFTPDGWVYTGSLSETYGFVPHGQEDKGLRFLRHEGGIDVYHSELTGKEVYIARTKRNA
jgi:hypothetical protein